MLLSLRQKSVFSDSLCPVSQTPCHFPCSEAFATAGVYSDDRTLLGWSLKPRAVLLLGCSEIGMVHPLAACLWVLEESDGIFLLSHVGQSRLRYCWKQLFHSKPRSSEKLGRGASPQRLDRETPSFLPSFCPHALCSRCHCAPALPGDSTYSIQNMAVLSATTPKHRISPV